MISDGLPRTQRRYRAAGVRARGDSRHSGLPYWGEPQHGIRPSQTAVRGDPGLYGFVPMAGRHERSRGRSTGLLGPRRVERRCLWARYRQRGPAKLPTSAKPEKPSARRLKQQEKAAARLLSAPRCHIGPEPPSYPPPRSSRQRPGRPKPRRADGPNDTHREHAWPARWRDCRTCEPCALAFAVLDPAQLGGAKVLPAER